MPAEAKPKFAPDFEPNAPTEPVPDSTALPDVKKEGEVCAESAVGKGEIDEALFADVAKAEGMLLADKLAKPPDAGVLEEEDAGGAPKGVLLPAVVVGDEKADLVKVDCPNVGVAA